MESFEKLQQRANDGQWDFDQLLKWYYNEQTEKEKYKKALKKISDMADKQPTLNEAICKICDKVLYNIN